MLKLILLFTVIPLLELTLLIRLSHLWGTTSTILLVAITGIIGAKLTKLEGTSTISKINASLEQGKMPTDNLVDGLLILIGGAMLITPGLLTDLGGFSCIIPLTRSKIKILTKHRLSKLITTGRVQFSSNNSQEEVDIKIEDE
ncbi:FxsA family protein [Natroniella sulfidigena]|uniref:FxsA family protein n=1 Tax=Natroniella sulfidigena TaxID=723921 RepID=UPI00200AF03E|nr:FxsA family protein [Natroniella sulfidigena]MCK8817238.1 FxsA family protein [Natroniella sulfidigena]